MFGLPKFGFLPPTAGISMTPGARNPPIATGVILTVQDPALGSESGAYIYSTKLHIYL